MRWQTVTAILFMYGTIKEFRPATPFLTPFLVSEFKNFTKPEVYSQIYPYWTYSYLAALVPMFILTDILRYKPIIILEAAGLVFTWILLVFGERIWQMQLMQFAFGVSSASEIAYYAYIYAVVDKKHYTKATSYIRTATLVGKLFAFGFSQLMISMQWGTYMTLNKITLIAVILSFLIVLFLPGLQFENPRIRPDVESLTNIGQESEFEPKETESYLAEFLRRNFEELKICSKNVNLITWSIWWILATCGMNQVQNYAQSLWSEMQFDSSNVANGGVEFINSINGAILSFSFQYFDISWKKYAKSVLPISTIIVAILLQISARTTKILIVYASYILVNAIYDLLKTAASSNVAEALSNTNSHGLVFGVNTFFAVSLQSLMTLLIVDNHFLSLDIRTQFIFYSFYYAIIGCLLFIFWCHSCFAENAENEDETCQ
ncbi:unnamed protein product [Caenorhabditis bovis]|uniref:Uncharacterized protein n=1 Tax=Caenorhabditis bovis TaxID=2654633 RepID=A0A8S1E8A1_9PELO|nr:unnamed protein product [Caenorhabditis bovis]